MSMVTVAWAAVGLLGAAVIGMFFSLYQLIQLYGQLSARMDTGFQALSARMDTGFQATGNRIDTLSGQLQAHIERHAG